MPGSSKYPKALDALPADKVSSTNAREGKPTSGPEGDHSGHHNALAAGVNAVQETLGTEPQGARDTVAERLTAVEGLAEAGTGVDPAGLATVGGDGTVGGPGGSPLSASVASRSEIVKIFRPQDFGANGKGEADDTKPLTEAIEAAQAAIVKATLAVVELGHGVYNISDEIPWEGAPIRGAWPHLCKIVWTGSAGATVINKVRAASPGMSTDLSGFMFEPGEHEPETWVSIPEPPGGGTGGDAFGILHHLFFGNCSGNSINSIFPTQANWHNLWFQVPTGYAINLTVPEPWSSLLFTLDSFQFSDDETGKQSKGLLRIDNTANQNIGTVALSKGRVEIDNGFTGNKGIVTLDSGDTVNHRVHFGFDSIVYADNISMTDDVLLYLEGEQSMPDIHIDNCQLSPASNLLGGPGLPTNFPTFPGGAQWKSLDITRAGGVGTRAATDATGKQMLEFHRALSGEGIPIAIFNNNETFERLKIEVTGAISLGEGTAAPDVKLERPAAKQLNVAGRFSANEGLHQVASASTITIANWSRIEEVTGTATIEKINATKAGQEVLFYLISTAKLKKSTTMKLLAEEVGGTAGTIVPMVFDGTAWRQTAAAVVPS